MSLSVRVCAIAPLPQLNLRLKERTKPLGPPSGRQTRQKPRASQRESRKNRQKPMYAPHPLWLPRSHLPYPRSRRPCLRRVPRLHLSRLWDMFHLPAPVCRKHRSLPPLHLLLVVTKCALLQDVLVGRCAPDTYIVSCPCCTVSVWVCMTGS